MNTHACMKVFGKPMSQLTPAERVRYKQLARKASYFRRHAANVDKQRADKQVRKRRVIEALDIAAACMRCGYDRYIGALDFHHLDPVVKSHNVLAKGFAAAVEEARKCELICANCHREAHRDEPTTNAGRPREHDPLLEAYMRATGCTDEQIAAMLDDRPELHSLTA